MKTRRSQLSITGRNISQVFNALSAFFNHEPSTDFGIRILKCSMALPYILRHELLDCFGCRNFFWCIFLLFLFISVFWLISNYELWLFSGTDLNYWFLIFKISSAHMEFVWVLSPQQVFTQRVFRTTELNRQNLESRNMENSNYTAGSSSYGHKLNQTHLLSEAKN